MQENDAFEQTRETVPTEDVGEHLIAEVMNSTSIDPEKTKGDREFNRAVDKCINSIEFHANGWGGKGAATFGIGACNDAANQGNLDKTDKKDFVRAMNSWTKQNGMPVVFDLGKKGEVYGTKRN